MLLKVSGVVRLSRDVEVRYTQSGTAIANFSVACSEKFKDQSGVQKEKTTFVDVTAFGRLAEICNQYLRKASQIYIIGKLSLEQWDDKNTGAKRSKHTITLESMEMLGSKNDGQGQGQSATGQQGQNTGTTAYQAPAPQAAQQQAAPEIPEIDIDDSEIPF